MTKNKIVIEVCIFRCILSAMLCMALFSTPAHAVWDYSLAAQIAIHDVIVATCEKTEPRLKAVLSDQWSEHVRVRGIEAIRSARKSSEYSQIYQGLLFDQLISSWGDSEEQAHACEEIYINFGTAGTKPHRWWQDRLCLDLPLDSEKGPGDGHRCGAGPGAKVSFENAIPDTEISILRLAPSSDVSFPPAGTRPQRSEPGYRIVSNDNAGHAWEISESVEFEWKEWPETVPQELKDKGDLESGRVYVDEVRGRVQRKRAQIVVRGRIPPDVIAEILQTKQAAKLEQSVAGRLNLFFIFMPDGLRFRWEQWHGRCIKKYGGDEIDLPRNQLLSGDWICGEPQPKPCNCSGTPRPASAALLPTLQFEKGVSARRNAISDGTACATTGLANRSSMDPSVRPTGTGRLEVD